ncbi:hypothetical protein BV22DRAFT_1031141 [Leucogyrophana mollusca]|uniref:Uncharacterized protein n=1 Tax=Leucogyrophana mollusca TaxID=85980 RepID=A0ACB8BS58_9AGAM|nr:hypothetical protein BV22DRAFT_1031141 [Leucogyrophana mollusca]
MLVFKSLLASLVVATVANAKCGYPTVPKGYTWALSVYSTEGCNTEWDHLTHKGNASVYSSCHCYYNIAPFNVKSLAFKSSKWHTLNVYSKMACTGEPKGTYNGQGHASSISNLMSYEICPDYF